MEWERDGSTLNLEYLKGSWLVLVGGGWLVVGGWWCWCWYWWWLVVGGGGGGDAGRTIETQSGCAIEDPFDECAPSPTT